jgi:predicted DNA-binding transcriptional regulator AlpA
MLANLVSPPTIDAALCTGEICSMPLLLGNTYGFGKALPNLFSNCLIADVETKTHMGEKLQQEAERRGWKPAQVAAFFGIKPPSVYDWYEHGRIHKKHYPKLIELSGKPIAWWLDIPKEDLEVREQPATYIGIDPRHTVLLQLFEGLPAREQDELIRSLKEKKQHYDSLMEELLQRRNAA